MPLVLVMLAQLRSEQPDTCAQYVFQRHESLLRMLTPTRWMLFEALTGPGR